jgi:MoaA/NifB/PqqE/SkfB family radical SAM enzyme
VGCTPLKRLLKEIYQWWPTKKNVLCLIDKETDNKKREVRYLDSRRGTIKSPKDMRKKICLQPFTNIDIQSNSELRVCSESWMPTGIGDYSKSTIMESWNSEILQKIRQSIYDGTYEFCDWHQCPFYCNDARYLYSIEELDSDKLKIYKPWIDYIKHGRTEIPIPPANFNFAYDETCNLECPSCRNTRKVYNSGEAYQMRKELQDKLLQEIMSFGICNIGRINISGSGEPFISRVFREFLFHFDGTNYPNLKINLQSNGILFTEDVWEKMSKIHNNINEVIISIDASTPETYSKIRCNGKFENLLKNIEFLSRIRAENKINRLMLAFVVQKTNFREMKEAINIGKKFKVDLFIFNLLNDWRSWSNEEFEANAVWKRYHPEYDEFIEVLKDPIFNDTIVDLGNIIEYQKIAIKSNSVTKY